ncbi:hypothetical protein E2C01_040533 [Portunus trituberculatus]|uniref:Uncharacterized protein n=1 Tax=Portunus trituberculatus TaxID=210409 RepID=A0A5B7FMX4_PORTR|nr:hypothetical protein [Portunus trituberculatus]
MCDVCLYGGCGEVNGCVVGQGGGSCNTGSRRDFLLSRVCLAFLGVFRNNSNILVTVEFYVIDSRRSLSL